MVVFLVMFSRWCRKSLKSWDGECAGHVACVVGSGAFALMSLSSSGTLPDAKMMWSPILDFALQIMAGIWSVNCTFALSVAPTVHGAILSQALLFSIIPTANVRTSEVVMSVSCQWRVSEGLLFDYRKLAQFARFFLSCTWDHTFSRLFCHPLISLRLSFWYFLWPGNVLC